MLYGYKVSLLFAVDAFFVISQGSDDGAVTRASGYAYTTGGPQPNRHGIVAQGRRNACLWEIYWLLAYTRRRPTTGNPKFGDNCPRGSTGRPDRITEAPTLVPAYARRRGARAHF